MHALQGDLQAASSKLEGLQNQVQQQQADKTELTKKLKSTEGELLQVQNDRQVMPAPADSLCQQPHLGLEYRTSRQYS